jgi:hypothetical protein
MISVNKLPKPPGNNRPRETPQESHKMVRERSFPVTDITDITDMLKAEKATGQLLIDMNQGGIGSIRFREEQKIRFNDL